LFTVLWLERPVQREGRSEQYLSAQGMNYQHRRKKVWLEPTSNWTGTLFGNGRFLTPINRGQRRERKGGRGSAPGGGTIRQSTRAIRQIGTTQGGVSMGETYGRLIDAEISPNISARTRPNREKGGQSKKAGLHWENRSVKPGNHP